LNRCTPPGQRTTRCCASASTPIRPEIPAAPAGAPDAILEFCTQIVDATADLVCCFKPQIAYFAARRAEDQLEALIEHIHAKHPGTPVVLDAKRGDIGSTAEQYAVEAFERFKADAITVNPYMGRDSVDPYLAYPDKGVILLCRTPTPAAPTCSSSTWAGSSCMSTSPGWWPEEWNASGNCGLVVGATFPAEIARVRELTGDMPLLVPGIGAQGGDIAATLAAGRSTQMARA
jgi:orotidine-5'-phosphate decarboxylase